MTRESNTQSKHSNLSIVKKIGITFIIPIFLAVLGSLLVLSVGWEYISTGINYSKILFTKPPVTYSDYKFQVNNQVVVMPQINEIFAKLKIPNIELENDIYEGDSEEQLSAGIGHSRYSTLPGEGGKVVLCAHRDGYFQSLQYIEVGDEVIIETKYGTYYYEVDNIWIAENDDMTVTAPSDKEMLTMYTCYPFNYIGSAPQRYIVDCKFNKVEG